MGKELHLYKGNNMKVPRYIRYIIILIFAYELHIPALMCLTQLLQTSLIQKIGNLNMSTSTIDSDLV